MIIAAHPTRYVGQLFRSRLEARWAAFFDLVGWKWTYESLELEGWIPDFVIQPADITGWNGPIIVEVKPFLFPGDLQVAETQRKIENAHHGKEEVLLLGAIVGWDTAFNEPALGLLGCRYGLWGRGEAHNEEWTWENAVSQRAGRDFCADISGYGHRISGVWDGNNHTVGTDEECLDALWREAGNRVRWLGSQP